MMIKISDCKWSNATALNVFQLRARCVIGMIALIFANSSIAHEFWLESTKYQLAPDERLTITMRNGEDFTGELLPYVPALIEHFALHSSNQRWPIQADLGDEAIYLPVENQLGLQILRYQSISHSLVHESTNKFLQFAKADGVEPIAKAWIESESYTGVVRENYRRYSKLLFNRGGSTGHDAYLGMAFELVALDNPYSLNSNDSMRIQLLLKGKPVPNAKIVTYHKDFTDKVTRNIYTTNQRGIITLSFLNSGQYLLSAVHLKPVPRLLRFLNGIHIESFWASIVFGVAKPSDHKSKLSS